MFHPYKTYKTYRHRFQDVGNGTTPAPRGFIYSIACVAGGEAGRRARHLHRPGTWALGKPVLVPSAASARAPLAARALPLSCAGEAGCDSDEHCSTGREHVGSRWSQRGSTGHSSPRAQEQKKSWSWEGTQGEDEICHAQASKERGKKQRDRWAHKKDKIIL